MIVCIYFNKVKLNSIRQAAMLAFAVAVLLPDCVSLAQDSVKRALVVFSYSLTSPGVMAIGQATIDRLREKSPGELEIFSEFLDFGRVADPEHESRTAHYLAGKYAGSLQNNVGGRGATAVLALPSADILVPA